MGPPLSTYHGMLAAVSKLRGIYVSICTTRPPRTGAPAWTSAQNFSVAVAAAGCRLLARTWLLQLLASWLNDERLARPLIDFGFAEAEF